jgi:hypothetical protein
MKAIYNDHSYCDKKTQHDTGYFEPKQIYSDISKLFFEKVCVKNIGCERIFKIFFLSLRIIWTV